MDPTAVEAELRRLRNENPDLVIQMASLKKIPEKRSAEMIAEQTLRASERGTLLAERPELDLLLRLAGTSQIAVAIRTSGHQASGRKLLVAIGSAERMVVLERSLSSDKRYMSIEDGGLGSEGLTMVERAALLGTRT